MLLLAAVAICLITGLFADASASTVTTGSTGVSALVSKLGNVLDLCSWVKLSDSNDWSCSEKDVAWEDEDVKLALDDREDVEIEEVVDIMF